MAHQAATSAALWDPSMPELLPRYADFHHTHPQFRAQLAPRVREHFILKRIALFLFAPIVFVWVVSMAVFLIPVFVPLAVLFWLPVGAHYRERESPDPERVDEPTHASQGLFDAGAKNG